MIQLIVAQRLTSSMYFEANRRPGDVVWLNTEAIARYLIESGLCKLPVAPPEAPASAPHEAKPAAPEFRKSVGEAGLRSIVSPSSTAHGRVRLSRSSAAVLVSPQRI